MVRCCKALSNPPPSCYNLHKVKIHVRRLRSGNGGSSSCAGDPHPQLDSPGPAGSAGGTPNRRARFRYCVVFSALQEWCLKGETRKGGREGFWAGGATAICKAFVWPNYYKAPYAMNCQRRACCYMTRGMKRVSFLSPILHHEENRKISQGLHWNQAKQRGAPGLRSALPGCSLDGIGPPATAVVGGAGPWGAGPWHDAESLVPILLASCRLQAGRWWVGGRTWSAPSYSHVESVPPPTEKAALRLLRQHFISLGVGCYLVFLALWCINSSLSFYVFIFLEESCIHCREDQWAKSTILHPKVVTDVTCLCDILIPTHILKITGWQENCLSRFPASFHPEKK